MCSVPQRYTHRLSQTRANEIFFTRTINIHIEKKYFITGSKTLAGKNREIPIHRETAKIIKKIL